MDKIKTGAITARDLRLRFELKGVDEPVEICEVRAGEAQALSAPKTTEKARRVEAPGEEPVLGWRPAVGQVVPNTLWMLEQKLGEGGFGEVWLGRHWTMKERQRQDGPMVGLEGTQGDCQQSVRVERIIKIWDVRVRRGIATLGEPEAEERVSAGFLADGKWPVPGSKRAYSSCKACSRN